MATKRVAMLAFEQCQILDVVGPLQVFASANKLLGFDAYETGILAETEAALTSNSGMQLLPRWSLPQLQDQPLHTLLVAGGSGVEAQQYNSVLLIWLAEQATSVERLGSVCTGAFLLAKAGLLDGQKVATHWRYCQTLAQQFPGLQVDGESIYLQRGRLYSSAGVTSGIDMALAMLAEDQGTDLASSVARELVVFGQRPGDQRQYSVQRQADSALPKQVQAVIELIQLRLQQPISVDDLAEHVHLSPRHLARLFKQHLAVTPSQYLEAARVERVRACLQQTDWGLERIAQHSGLSSADNLRRQFVRHMGVTPSDYRQRFNLN